MVFMSVILVILVAFLSMFIPGFLLSLALLRKTELHIFEIGVIGFIFGMVGPATLTWMESYLINYVHFFSFSLELFELNILLLTVIGAALCYREGVFDSILKNGESKPSSDVHSGHDAGLHMVRAKLRQFAEGAQLVEKHIQEEETLKQKQEREISSIKSGFNEEEQGKILALHKKELHELVHGHEAKEKALLESLEKKQDVPAKKKSSSLIWWVLLGLMLLSFATRIANISTAPTFFEFDPYFDMIDAKSILTLGYQFLLDPSAWPVVPIGTNHRIQPLIPYLESYWYSLANAMGYHHAAFSNSLMSYVGGFYPPIAAALLTFVIFVLLYHEYNEYVGLIGAALVTTMPTLVSTFVAGEQLLEQWGIFSLFFFFATYLLAVRNVKNKRYAILAGIAFASTFLGAHYYTVDTGVLTIYILMQGAIDVFRNRSNIDFYKMNAIVILVIALFFAFYHPYQATLGKRIPSILGIPITLSGPILALIVVLVFDYVPKLAKNISVVKNNSHNKVYAGWFLLLLIAGILAIFFTPLGSAVRGYLNLSAKFTTPSSPLFMTVQEFIPTGLMYNFGGPSGFGYIGSDIAGLPLLVWIVCALAIALIVISVIYRESRSGVFYLAIALPLMYAAFSEVKYLPHFGVAYIMLFSILLGELVLMSRRGWKLPFQASGASHIPHTDKKKMPIDEKLIYLVGVYFISPALAVAYLVYLYINGEGKQSADGAKGGNFKIVAALSVAVVLIVATAVTNTPTSLPSGEIGTVSQTLGAALTYKSASPSSSCNTITGNNNALGASMFCNTVPSYWLSAAAWMASNVGPTGPRILSWWDYGDWINWFGNSNAVLRGDNSVPTEDYATAANYVLGNADNYTTKVLRNFMETNQTKYVLFDQGLVNKWGALDFLACIHTNATSESFARSVGASQNPPVPYQLGTSPCEISHDPQMVLVPLEALIPSNQTQQVRGLYCPISNSTTLYARGLVASGGGLTNQTVCVDLSPSNNGVMQIYNNTAGKTNAVINANFYLGLTNIGQTKFVEFLEIYLPNSNGTITNPPSGFYTSNFYKGFFLGHLSGFTQVYPNNATGINYVNGIYPIRIFALDNYTGGTPSVPVKPSWVHNNYTLP